VQVNGPPAHGRTPAIVQPSDGSLGDRFHLIARGLRALALAAGDVEEKGGGERFLVRNLSVAWYCAY
jgi:hypothetical protein